MDLNTYYHSKQKCAFDLLTADSLHYIKWRKENTDRK
jgi:hypothetical protein